MDDNYIQLSNDTSLKVPFYVSCVNNYRPLIFFMYTSLVYVFPPPNRRRGVESIFWRTLTSGPNSQQMAPSNH